MLQQQPTTPQPLASTATPPPPRCASVPTLTPQTLPNQTLQSHQNRLSSETIDSMTVSILNLDTDLEIISFFCSFSHLIKIN